MCLVFSYIFGIIALGRRKENKLLGFGSVLAVCMVVIVLCLHFCSAVGWSVVHDCDVSWPYSLALYPILVVLLFENISRILVAKVIIKIILQLIEHLNISSTLIAYTGRIYYMWYFITQ